MIGVYTSFALDELNSAWNGVAHTNIDDTLRKETS